MTNTWDAANHLIETAVSSQPLAVSYDGLGNRVAQTVGLTPTYFALDVAIGLPEVIYTSEGNAYLHLPGVIMTENATGTVRYLLSDGLGSIRQATDDGGTVVSYREFDPYGNPVQNGGDPYGYTGEWWEAEVGLLYLRARWYVPETGTFLNMDPLSQIIDSRFSTPAFDQMYYFNPELRHEYIYSLNNPISLSDPSGYIVLWRFTQRFDGTELGVAVVDLNRIKSYDTGWRPWDDPTDIFAFGLFKSASIAMGGKLLLVAGGPLKMAQLARLVGLTEITVGGAAELCSMEYRITLKTVIQRAWFGEVGYAVQAGLSYGLEVKTEWVRYDYSGPDREVIIEATGGDSLVCCGQPVPYLWRERLLPGYQSMEDFKQEVLNSERFPEYSWGYKPQ